MTRIRILTGSALLGLTMMVAGTQAATYVANLSGGQEVPPHATPATGQATAVLTGNVLSFSGSFSGLVANYSASHIHSGAVGVNGGVVFALTTVPAGTAGAWLPGANNFTLTAAQLATLQAGNYYVNVHSLAFPGGEIRGQLLLAPPAPVTDLAISYDSVTDQVVLTWSATANAVSYRIESAPTLGGAWSTEGTTISPIWLQTPLPDSTRLFRVIALN